MHVNIKKLYNSWTVRFVVAIFIAIYLTIFHPWMNHWGATDAEADMPLSGDGSANGLIPTSTRGVTIYAPAEEVWKWIVQLGQERAGFYSEDWLENLTLANIHNASEIRVEWQRRQQGDKVFGAGGAVYGQSAFWNILAYEEGRAIYLWGPIAVIPVDAQTSRLVARTYAPPSLVTQSVNLFTFDWMHFVMERGMLLGIKARVEHTEEGALLRTFSTLGWILATLGIGSVLFMRRRGWWWGLIPLAYAVAIIIFTRDTWSATAGFLWWGIIAAGFILWGSDWWKGLSLAIVCVILVFVLADHPHTVFGIVFLIVFAGTIAITRLIKRPYPARFASQTHSIEKISNFIEE